MKELGIDLSGVKFSPIALILLLCKPNFLMPQLIDLGMWYVVDILLICLAVALLVSNFFAIYLILAAV